MLAQEGERRVKGIQKEFLARIEQHPIFGVLDAVAFNSLRKRVFRGTFAAYRLGVVGLDHTHTNLYSLFFGWLEEATVGNPVELSILHDATEMCFRTALESYRIGSMVAAHTEEERHEVQH